jgi:hypothetical protein
MNKQPLIEELRALTATAEAAYEKIQLQHLKNLIEALEASCREQAGRRATRTPYQVDKPRELDRDGYERMCSAACLHFEAQGLKATQTPIGGSIRLYLSWGEEEED